MCWAPEVVGFQCCLKYTFFCVDTSHLAGWTVHTGGVHHGHQAVHGTGQLLVLGRVLPGCELSPFPDLSVPSLKHLCPTPIPHLIPIAFSPIPGPCTILTAFPGPLVHIPTPLYGIAFIAFGLVEFSHSQTVPHSYSLSQTSHFN